MEQKKRKILAGLIILILAAVACAGVAAYCHYSNDGQQTIDGGYSVTYTSPGTMILGDPAPELTPIGYHFDYWTNTSDITDQTHYESGDHITLTEKSPSITLTAHFAANSYTIVFNGNNATSGTMDSQSFVYDTAQGLTEVAYERAGYSFLGWSMNSAAAEATYGNGANVSNLTIVDGGSVMLYAVWSANPYMITYTAGIGSGSDLTQSATEDSDVTLLNATFDLAYHDQIGWSYGTTTYTIGQTISYTFADDITLTAVYNEGHTYSVVSDSGDYTDIIAPSSATYGTPYTFSVTTTFTGEAGTFGDLIQLTVKIGGNDVEITEITDNGNGTYTIDGNAITGAVEISTEDINCYTVTYVIDNTSYVYDYYSCNGSYKVTVQSYSEVDQRIPPLGHAYSWRIYWWIGWIDVKSGDTLNLIGDITLYLIWW